MSDLDHELSRLREATSRVGASPQLKRSMVLAVGTAALPAGMAFTTKLVMTLAAVTVVAGGSWVVIGVHVETALPPVAPVVVGAAPQGPGHDRDGAQADTAKETAPVPVPQPPGPAVVTPPGLTVPFVVDQTVLPTAAGDCVTILHPTPQRIHFPGARAAALRLTARTVVGVHINPPGTPLSAVAIPGLLDSEGHVVNPSAIDSKGWWIVAADNPSQIMWLEVHGFEPVILSVAGIEPGEWSLGEVRFEPLEHWADLVVHVNAPIGEPELTLRGRPCGDPSNYRIARGPSVTFDRLPMRSWKLEASARGSTTVEIDVTTDTPGVQTLDLALEVARGVSVEYGQRKSPGCLVKTSRLDVVPGARFDVDDHLNLRVEQLNGVLRFDGARYLGNGALKTLGCARGTPAAPGPTPALRTGDVYAVGTGDDTVVMRFTVR